MDPAPLDKAADAFARELAQWRAERRLSQKRLAAMMGFDPSYVSHMEGRRHRPTRDFAKRAEAALEAGGAIWARFHEYDALRRPVGAGTLGTPGADGHGSAAAEQWALRGTGLVIEDEHALLRYHEPLGGAGSTDGASARTQSTGAGPGTGEYRCIVRRWLYNAGPEPVIRFPVRIDVDRYPGQADRSNEYHRRNPLTLAELDLRAFRGLAVRGEATADEGTRGEVDGGEPGEPMSWRAFHDRDSRKKIWLLFENNQGRFPLYPGQRTMIEYSYRVAAEKWGTWFQRSVRLPTRRLSIRLEFPAVLRPIVWGVQESLAAEMMPLRTPPVEQADGDRTSFDWHTDQPALYAQYRLEWRFRIEHPSGTQRG